MKILVTGCGSIGRRHIKNLLAIGGMEIIGHDPVIECRGLAKEQFNIKVYEDYDAALSASPDAVVVATPTNAHVAPALKAARAGCHFFIEKPVAHIEDGLPELLAAVKEKGLITLVGCNMRFHPGLRKVKELLDNGSAGRILTADIETGSYMPEWRAGVDYRKVYSSRKDMGGGVILDAIHEIDYAAWMLGRVMTVACMADKVSCLEMDVEDAADIIIRYSSGVIGHIHLDYLQRAYSRRCKFVGEDGVIKWDFAEKRTGLYLAKDKKWTWFDEPAGYDINQMYVDEMAHFVNCLKGQESPMLDLVGGCEDLKIALAAKRSAEEQRFVSLTA